MKAVAVVPGKPGSAHLTDIRRQQQTPLMDDVAAHGRHDLVFEATGYSPIVFDAMCYTLARNGRADPGQHFRWDVPQRAAVIKTHVKIAE
jgi:hypothetical protein